MPRGPTPKERAFTIGELCVGGDWACAHGDLAGLRHIAKQLAEQLREPMHCDLVILADSCYGDPDQAVARWMALKDQLYGANQDAIVGDH
jgi:hypothetical protein